MGAQNVTTTQPSIGRRREGRLRVRLGARLIGLDGTGRAVLADISSHGARLIGEAPFLRQGAEVVLQWCGLEAFGQVVWQEAGQCGVSFYDPVPQAELFATREVDNRERLPSDNESVRRVARAFVQGRTRI